MIFRFIFINTHLFPLNHQFAIIFALALTVSLLVTLLSLLWLPVTPERRSGGDTPTSEAGGEPATRESWQGGSEEPTLEPMVEPRLVPMVVPIWMERGIEPVGKHSFCAWGATESCN